MFTRIITALVVLALFLPALIWLPDQGWELFCGMVLIWCAWEWGRLAGLKGAAIAIYAIAIAVAAMALLLIDVDGARPVVYLLSAAFWLIVAPPLLKMGPERCPRLPLMISLLLGLVVLAAVFLALVELRTRGVAILLITMSIVWISDSLAYFTGRAWGRHKLAPAVSPGKTWEGVAGGLTAVGLYAAAICMVFLKRPEILVQTVLIFVALAAVGIVGDLMESLLKRWAGVKDSGKMLPGHGGILDRVDALLPVLPLAALAYRYFPL